MSSKSFALSPRSGRAAPTGGRWTGGAASGPAPDAARGIHSPTWRGTARPEPPSCRDVRVTRRYLAPPASVFAAWLDPDVARRWLFATASQPLAAVTIEARVGGSFRFEDKVRGVGLVHRGRYVEIAAPRRLAFTLTFSTMPSFTTRVAIDIEAIEGACRLVLAHTGVPASVAPYMRNRWTGILHGLEVTLDAIGQAPAYVPRSPS